MKTFRDMLGELHTYTYDANGNITSETIGEVGAADAEVKEYYYDSQNRLIRYNDSELYTTFIYNYDSRGNILNYAVYDYAAGESAVDEATAYAYDYAYNNSTWKDLVTTIMGENITYDEIGNPKNWQWHKSFTWQNGRQLARVDMDGRSTVEYTYNGDGLRTGKSNARDTVYIILDGTYLGERTTIDGTEYLIVYIYGADGSVMGLEVNGTAYYFVKNLQGDVTAIIDAEGNVYANYSYDAYGYIMGITDSSGNQITSDTHIANLNPFRYRGYIYDQETGFYYLTSRYYDPAVCRFLNADGQISGAGGDIQGYNQFAYCFNNPVNMDDQSGNWPKWATVALGVAVAAAAIAVTVATLGAAAPAAVSTLTGMGMALGASYTVASTVATVAVATTTVAAVAYAGDIAYASVTGDSILLNTVFQGNTEAYNTGLTITSIATGGMLEAAAQAPPIVAPDNSQKTALHTSGTGSPKNNANPGGSYTKFDNSGNLYSYTQFDDFSRQTMRIDFQGRPHAGVLPHIHLFTYPQQGGKVEYVFDLDWNLIN